MLRFTLLAIGLLAVAPFSPLGCPPAQVVPDTLLPGPRDTIATTATAPVSAVVGDNVRLRATVTGESGVVRYAWLQIAGPGVAVSDAGPWTANFKAPSVKTDQTLRFAVTTHNDAGAMGRAEVSITITADPNYGLNQPTTRPVADAGVDQARKPDSEVTLGSSSALPGQTYHWRQVSGTPVTLTTLDAAQTKFTVPAFDASGTNILLFELSATNAAGRTVTDRVQVKVKDPNSVVKFETNLGSFTVEVDLDKAPISAANFLKYVDDGFYDGTIFHRVIPGFMVQGGGFRPDLTEKETRPAIALEANNGLSNVRGTLAMARTDDPNSATSQFFINLKNNVSGGDGATDLDPGGVSAEGYAVFGEVTAGMDTVDAIAAVATDSRNGMQDVPTEDVIIQSAKRVTVPPSGGSTAGG